MSGKKPRQVLKAGPGGLLDVEFIAQAGSLKWGKKYEFDASNTSRALLKMSEKGLLPNSAVESLVEGYAFLRDLENRLLLLGREGANGIPEDSEMLLWLLGCLNRYGNPPPPNGPWNERTLREAEAGIRSRNREIFETFFATVFPMD